MYAYAVLAGRKYQENQSYVMIATKILQLR
nr:MAG TPA: hypothetical protein [Bacteriophage sp.]